MRQVTISSLGAVWLLVAAFGVARAQEPPGTAIGSEPGPAPIIEAQTAAPTTATRNESTVDNKYLAYDLYRRDELERSIPRTRKALIATSVVFGVGLALVIPVWAGDHCVTVTVNSRDDYQCDTAGKVLLGIGAPLAWGGSTGMIVSGIMLGVRKGKLRRVNERIMMTSDRRLRWDPSTSRFVF
jgi:hypothetical protein